MSEKPISIKKAESLALWRALPENMPLTPGAIAYKHEGTTIDEDGIRICGTPGPWIYKATAGDHDFAVYSEFDGKDIALVRDFNEAHASLIASAPELLAALQGFLDWHKATPNPPDGWLSEVKRNAESVIAQVKGGAQ